MRAAVEDDLWRLADVGRFKQLRLEPQKDAQLADVQLQGVLEGDEGQVQLGAVCLRRAESPVALIVLQPLRGSTTLAGRMAGTITWPGK